jgi:hypothetical protein
MDEAPLGDKGKRAALALPRMFASGKPAARLLEGAIDTAGVSWEPGQIHFADRRPRY